MFWVPASNLLGDDVVQGLLEANRPDHLAAALVGGHGIQQFGPPVQDAHARGAVKLVAGEGVEVAAQFPHVYGYVGHRLGPVQQHGNAPAVGQLDDFFHRVDGAQGVGLVDD